MKKQLILLAAAVTTTFLVGCASTSNQYGEGTPASQLAFTPVTSPAELVKWAHDFPNLRSMESYTFAAPVDTGAVGDELPEFSVNLPPGSVFVEPAGGPGDEPRTYRIIRHTPHQK